MYGRLPYALKLYIEKFISSNLKCDLDKHMFQGTQERPPEGGLFYGFVKLGRAPVYGWLCKPEEGKAADACQGFFSAK